MWRFWRTRLSWHGSRVPQREVLRQRASPPVWTVVAEWLSLPPTLDRLLWQAMSRSETPSVVRWRATLLDAQPDSAHDSPRVDRLLHGLLSPHSLIEVLETLVQTQEIARQDANAVEEYILERTAADGHWR